MYVPVQMMLEGDSTVQMKQQQLDGPAVAGVTM